LSSGQREVVAIREKESKVKKWVGYDEISYKDFKKFTEFLNKEVFINQSLTAESVEKITFRWMIDAYNKKNEKDRS
jgi:glutamine phosphoribosylpyrophosphate amidotransferase